MLKDIKYFINRLLTFLRVVDSHDRNISITNIALIITLYKLYMSPEASMVDVSAVMVSLSSYSLKKFINKDSINIATKIATQIAEKTESISPEKKE